jgi:hypothetical protein
MQRQMPPYKQWPWPEQLLGQLARMLLQPAPPKSPEHMHCPDGSHRPLPEQAKGQALPEEYRGEGRVSAVFQKSTLAQGWSAAGWELVRGWVIDFVSVRWTGGSRLDGREGEVL